MVNYWKDSCGSQNILPTSTLRKVTSIIWVELCHPVPLPPTMSILRIMTCRASRGGRWWITCSVCYIIKSSSDREPGRRVKTLALVRSQIVNIIDCYETVYERSSWAIRSISGWILKWLFLFIFLHAHFERSPENLRQGAAFCSKPLPPPRPWQ